MKKLMYYGLLFFYYSTGFALEMRAIIDSVDEAKRCMSNMPGEYKGSYSFTDYIYFPNQTESDVSYARIRVYKESNWGHKGAFLAIKLVDQNIALKQKFDSTDQAQDFLSNTHSYRFAFNFYRTGWEYKINEASIFIERIANLPDSVEIISPNEKEILEIFQYLGAKEILKLSIPLYYQDIIKHKTDNK